MIGEDEDYGLPGDGEPFGDGHGTYRDSFEGERQSAVQAMARALAFPGAYLVQGEYRRALHQRCVGKQSCVRAHGELAITADGKCGGCGVSWWLANPAGTKRTPEHLRSDRVN